VSPEVFEATSPFESGESGGPILDSNGEIIGLCEGSDVRTKIGWGPSVIAIRRFLGLPGVGQDLGEQPESVPMRPGVPVSGGAVVPVPPPPVPDNVTPAVAPAATAVPATPASGGDAPPFVPPDAIPDPTPASKESEPESVTVPARTPPKPIPDPISTPIEPAPASPTESSAGNQQPVTTSQGSSVVTKLATVVKVASTGFDVWSMLAGATAVAGTGGIGGLAWLAWRGFKAVRAIKTNAQSSTSQPAGPPSPAYHPPVTNPHGVPLAPHNVQYVQVPNDFRKASVDYALAQTAYKYPGAVGTLEVFTALVNQHLQATGHGPETLHSPFQVGRA
jgi:hypothetical protein